MFGRQSKFLMWINYRIRVTIQDNRVLIGTFLAFDKHMNLVLADTEEYSHFKSKKNKVDKERKRSMGLVLLRGDSIISISAESPPSQNTKRFNEMPNPGIGIAQAIGRGLTNQQQAQPGLGSIGRGVGIPNMMAMVPPQPIGRGMPPRMPMPPTAMRMTTQLQRISFLSLYQNFLPFTIYMNVVKINFISNHKDRFWRYSRSISKRLSIFSIVSV